MQSKLGRRALFFAAAAAIIQGNPRGAFAATSTWSDGSGNWNVAGNWTPSGVPGAGTTVDIVETDGVSRTITYNYNGSSVTLGSLTLDLTGGSAGSTTQLLMAANNLSSGSETIGASGNGTFNQSGGINTDNGGFGIGSATGSVGTYFLSGGTLSANAGAAVGLSGTGNFDQTAATFTVSSGNLNIGFNTGSSGNYQLSGGLLNVSSGSVYVGGNPTTSGGKGNLGISGSGYLNTGNTANITVYNTAGSALTFSGGTINTGSLNLNGNPGLFNWTGGTLNWNNAAVNAIIDSGNSANLASTLNLTNQSLFVAGQEMVGYTGTGIVNQSGGNNNIGTSTANGILNVGYFVGSNGIYDISGGGFLNVYGFEQIGVSSTGLVNQSGGGNIIEAGSVLSLGAGAGGNGTYLLSGNGGITALGTEDIGNASIGTFNQSGGNNELSSGAILYVGYLNGSTGTYILTGTGTLTSNSGEYIGYSGLGTFNQTGGTHTLTSTSTLYVGYNAGSTGTYILAQGGTLNANDGEYIGYSGNGNFSQTGGANNAPAGLFLAFNMSSSASYTLSGGNLVASMEMIGDAANQNYNGGNLGFGTFTQTGGTNTVTGDGLFLGSNFFPVANTSTYNLGGGSLIVNFREFIGYTGSGTLNQTGGLNSVANNLYVAFYNSRGLYALSGGTLYVGGNEVVGVDDSIGTFNQSGGTNTVGGSLMVGNESGIGYYNLDGGATVVASSVLVSDNNGSNGSLTVSGTGSLSIGNTLNVNSSGGAVTFTGGTISAAALNFNGAPANFGWTGGTLDITASVTWDSGAASTSTSDAFGSSLSLGVGQTLVITGNETLGGVGSFALTVGSGATHTVTGTLALTPQGALYLAGGTLNTGGLDFDGLPFFIWTAGTLNLTNSVTWDSGSSVTSTSDAFGSSLSLASGQTLMVSGNETIGNVGPFTLTLNAGSSHIVSNTLTINPNGSLVFNGGSLTYAALSLNGGTISGSGVITNNGTMSGFGTITGSAGFINNLLLNQSGGSLTISNTGTNLNLGTINLTTSGELQLTGGTVINGGTINLNSSAIAGTAALNNSGGSITGPGAILVPFSNSASVVVPAGTTTLSEAFTNAGSIILTAPAANLDGGPIFSLITNTGTIQGLGSIADAIANSGGTVEASGGTLTINGSLTNPVGGTIWPSANNEILVTIGLTTNAGLISLTGGIFDNGGHTLNNTGQISGYGTLRTGGLTNNGIFTLTGGTSTINGNVTNSAGKNINIEFNPAIFTGNITNNGTITVTNTTVTFTGSYTGNAYVSDPSTNIFQNNVTIVAGGSMTGGSGDQYYLSGGVFTNQGTFSNGGLLQSSDNVINSGSFTQTGPQSWAAGTTFNNTAGTATFGSDAGAGGANLTVNLIGGSVAFTSTQHLASLNISSGTTATVTGGGNGHRSVLFTPSLSDSGTLNLTANDLDVQDGGTAALATVSALVAKGYSSGAWTGGGITSSSAANDSSHLTALGVILNNIAGVPIYTAFDGAAVAVNDVLVQETYYGDANLDGKVDASDYSRIDNGYLNHLSGWYNGDFNYDGVANGSDYTLIDNAFNTQGAQLDSSIASVAAVATAQIAGTASVPEPVSGVLLGTAALALLGRRCRRSGSCVDFE